MQSQIHAFTYDIAMANVIDTLLLQTEKRGNGFNGSYKYNGT
jgi:hypothetical protein